MAEIDYNDYTKNQLIEQLNQSNNKLNNALNFLSSIYDTLEVADEVELCLVQELIGQMLVNSDYQKIEG